MPLWRALTQPCRAMHWKTNEINNFLLVSAGFVVKLATKKTIVRSKTYLKSHNTATAKHLHSHQDLNSQVRKTEAGTML